MGSVRNIVSVAVPHAVSHAVVASASAGPLSGRAGDQQRLGNPTMAGTRSQLPSRGDAWVRFGAGAPSPSLIGEHSS